MTYGRPVAFASLRLRRKRVNFVKAQYSGSAASTTTRRETMAAFFGDHSRLSSPVWRRGSWRDRGALLVVAREVGHAVRSLSADQSKFAEVLKGGGFARGREAEGGRGRRESERGGYIVKMKMKPLTSTMDRGIGNVSLDTA